MEMFIELFKTMPVPFNFVAMISMFAILCGLIYACYSVYQNNALKRDLLNKGMSADDIERVINAGKSSPKIEDQPSKQGAASHATAQRPSEGAPPGCRQD